MDLMQHDRQVPDSPASHEAEQRLVPGKLRGDATLTLQTQQAARLVRGRAQTTDKPQIIGLLGFAALCRTIWHGARADDPYADWWQLRVDSALSESRSVIDLEAARLDDSFAASDGFSIEPARSERPVRIALNFTNPDAFRAAQLMGRYDQLACRVLALRHTGGLTRDDAMRLLNSGGRAVRRALQSAVGYRFLGIDRAAMRQQTALTAQARQVMGECPESLLHGTQSQTNHEDSPAMDDTSAGDSARATFTADTEAEPPGDTPADAPDLIAPLQETPSHGAP